MRPVDTNGQVSEVVIGLGGCQEREGQSSSARNLKSNVVMEQSLQFCHWSKTNIRAKMQDETTWETKGSTGERHKGCPKKQD